MSNQDRTGAIDRRDVLKGLSAASAGAVGVAATSGTAAAGTVTGGCAIAWPDATEAQLELAGGSPAEEGPVPDSGDLVIYVHGYFGEDLIDSIDVFNGSNQATALRFALEEQGVDAPVVAGMWESTTGWGDAKSDADTAGEALATWVDENGDAYDSITVFGHSLGSRVTLAALNELAARDGTITSAGLLGPGVGYETVCDRYATGIAEGVEDAVYNYYSGDDDVVCQLFRLAELTFEGQDVIGLGCEGTGCTTTPENIVDVNLTGEVKGHCNYFKPTSMEYEGGTGAQEIVDQQLGYLLGPDDGTVTGTVTASGDPAAGVTVDVRDPATGATVTTASTGSGGGYTVELAPGTYELGVDDPGYTEFSTEVTVTENATSAVDIEIAEMGSVAGFVTNGRGEYLTGIVVECLAPETGEAVAAVTTDDIGQYTMDLPVGTYEMHVDAEGYAPVTETVTVTADTTAQVDMSLRLPPVVGDQPPRDLTGDGLYRNVRGDGEFDILDVQALFNNLDSDAVQNHADAYNFSGTDGDTVTVLDVQALFNDLQDTTAGSEN
jgi:hypothetical protein